MRATGTPQGRRDWMSITRLAALLTVLVAASGTRFEAAAEAPASALPAEAEGLGLGPIVSACPDNQVAADEAAARPESAFLSRPEGALAAAEDASFPKE